MFRSMKLFAIVGLALGLLAGATVQTAAADNSCELVLDLVAGQHDVVGTVTVTKTATAVDVEYEITDSDWCIVEAHTFVGTTAPKKSAPGKFPYKSEHDYDDCVQTVTHSAPFADVGDLDAYFVAAHAVVQTEDSLVSCDIATIEAALPPLPVTMSASVNGVVSYFTTTITNGGFLNGVYEGWCVDTSRTIGGSTRSALAYSSYDSDVATLGLVDKPANIDALNWLLNQDWVGKTAGGGGTITQGDVQRAIWTIIDDGQSSSGLGTWTQAHVDQIVADALTNGDGFVPSCGDCLAVILVPVDENLRVNAQITVICIELSGEDFRDETAWALVDTSNPEADFTYFGEGWGGYFEFECD